MDVFCRTFNVNILIPHSNRGYTLFKNELKHPTEHQRIKQILKNLFGNEVTEPGACRIRECENK